MLNERLEAIFSRAIRWSATAVCSPYGAMVRRPRRMELGVGRTVPKIFKQSRPSWPRPLARRARRLRGAYLLLTFSARAHGSSTNSVRPAVFRLGVWCAPFFWAGPKGAAPACLHNIFGRGGLGRSRCRRRRGPNAVLATNFPRFRVSFLFAAGFPFFPLQRALRVARSDVLDPWLGARKRTGRRLNRWRRTFDRRWFSAEGGGQAGGHRGLSEAPFRVVLPAPSPIFPPRAEFASKLRRSACPNSSR